MGMELTRDCQLIPAHHICDVSDPIGSRSEPKAVALSELAPVTTAGAEDSVESPPKRSKSNLTMYITCFSL